MANCDVRRRLANGADFVDYTIIITSTHTHTHSVRLSRCATVIILIGAAKATVTMCAYQAGDGSIYLENVCATNIFSNL